MPQSLIMMLRAVCLALVAVAAAQEDGPLVETVYGTVRGTHHVDAAYSSFTGIRYALAPTGRDRFGSPSPPPSWEGIFVADQGNIFCPQVWNGDYVGTEDCLILNVYAPDTASETNPLSVIVYVHGGGFFGSSSSYFGPDQLLPHDVMLVTVNYRVGPLGHLCLGHELVPGNAAFKDQVAALRWVRDNIAAFGGNPDSVTIMGQSSGGASVDLLTLSPMTAGLFKGAISLSGAARAYWAIVPDPVAIATRMAEIYMDYNGNSLEDLVEFYLAADVEALSVATAQLFQGFGFSHLPFAGCVEQEFPGAESFLTDTPANILASGEYISIPKIYTVTNKEYVNMITPEEVNNITEIVAHLREYLPHDLKIQTDVQRSEIVNRLRAFYVNDETSPLEGFIDFMSDSMFYYGLVRSARERQATSSSPVYVMEFAFESAMRVQRLPAVDGITGTGHGDDVLFVIARIGAGTTLTAADQLTTDRYGLMFTNFAKYGNPTPQNAPVAWAPLTATQFHYLQLGSELVLSQAPRAAAIELWDQIYVEAEKPHVQIAQGLVRGKHHSEAGYSSFLGIRYGTIPTGRYRFASPSPPPSWEGIFVADQDNIVCPQVWNGEYVGTDDCLILNVYTPDTASETNPLSVIVYVHGGGFFGGSSSYFGPDQLLPHDVVLVTVNYRVGPLGHLCLGHELVPGNAAFKDQVAALRWVRDNIAAFGGNPDSVTIMGQSSGGASVDLLTLSPMTAGLFKGAISLSGAARAYWAIVPDPVAIATRMAEIYMDYNGNSLEDLVEFYLAADVEALSVATAQLFQGFGFSYLPFAGCVEQEFPGAESFLTDTPANILASGEYISIPKIYTVTNKEYVNMITPEEVNNITEIVEHLREYLPHDLKIQTAVQRSEIVNRLRAFYVNDETSPLEGFIDFMSDSMFYYGLVRSARERQATSSSPVYVMEFAFESAMRVQRLPAVDGITGTGHGDDVLFVIARIGAGTTLTAADELTTVRYGLMFTNFAKYGNPTPQNAPVAWAPLTATQFHYLQLGSELVLSQAPRAAAIELWDQIYAEAEKPHVQIVQGLVRGTHHSEAEYSSFLGIRYGTIPTGRDRFTSPSSPPSWEGIFVADQDNIVCPQIWNGEYIGTEDCLILNVYSPDSASETNPLSVIVYVHGGGFFGGSSSYFGPEQLLPHDVVLVTVNYRVGPLGHLCLGHELVPGNAAFKDQVAALRWVRDNIAAFGGNPDSVTIMGQSSGGVSVDLLTLSPMTEGLFKGAISLSGAARAYWAIVPDPVAVATRMAEVYMDYNGNSLEDLVEFYLTADVEALSVATVRFINEFGFTYLPFAGCVELEFPGAESFLTDTPANILASGEYTSIPKIYTVTHREFVNMITPEEVNNITEIVAHLGEYLPHDLTIETADQRSEIVNRLRAFYVNDETSPLEGYINFMSDSLFYYGLARSARERQAKSSSPVYVMEFTFESEMRVDRLTAVDGITGTGHGDDVIFVIARIGAGTTLTPADQLTTERYGLLFSNFAKYGEPTPQNEPVAWLPLTDEQLHYLDLGSELSVSHSPNAAAIALWDEIYAAGTSARVLPSLFALVLTALLLLFNIR